jgi:hypothetical protein
MVHVFSEMNLYRQFIVRLRAMGVINARTVLKAEGMRRAAQSVFATDWLPVHDLPARQDEGI